MRIAIIAALARNGVIGRGDGLPWHLPDDLAHFKASTLDRPMVMGRKTWETLPGALPRREHVVITRQPGYEARGATVVHSLEEALAHLAGAPEVCIVGGAEIYAAALPIATDLVLTHVEADVEGDTFFPEVDWSAWRVVDERAHPADARHAYPFRITMYERR